MGLSIMSIVLYISCGKDDAPTPEPEGVEITGFTPASGEVGTEVTVNGKNFSTSKSENSVSFNGTAATVKIATATSLKVDVPNGATTGKIKVTVGSSSATSTEGFEVLIPEPIPVITNFTEGEWEWEDTVNITGTDFSPTGNTVLINGVEAEIVEESETLLVVTVPYGSRTGKVTVIKANNGPSTESSDDLVIRHGKWTQIADFGGGKRRNVASFVLNGTAYVGLGTDNSTANKDMWEYNQTTDTWTKMNSEHPGDNHLAPASFVIENTAYIGTGFLIGAGIYYPDFRTYTPDTDEWTDINSFDSAARYLSVSFSIGDKGYIGTGITEENISLRDFWEYDPGTGTWTQKANVGGILNERYSAVGFAIGNKGYIGTGHEPFNIDFRKDFWEYDPSNNTWTQKADVGGEEGLPRAEAVGFSIGEKCYVGLGRASNVNILKDFWEYDPSIDIWTRIADFKGDARTNATAFVLGNKVYVGLGYDVDGNALSDFWVLDLTN